MTTKDDFKKLELLRERLKTLSPQQDIAADLIREEIKALVASMSYGAKAEEPKTASSPFDGCNVIQVRSGDRSLDGRVIRNDDLQDGDIIDDSDTIGLY